MDLADRVMEGGNAVFELAVVERGKRAPRSKKRLCFIAVIMALFGIFDLGSDIGFVVIAWGDSLGIALASLLVISVLSA